MAVLGVFVAGIGVPDGLTQKATAAEAPSSGGERSVDGHPIAPKAAPEGVEDAQTPVKRIAPRWPKAGSGKADLSKGAAAVAVAGLPVSVAAVETPSAQASPKAAPPAGSSAQAKPSQPSPAARPTGKATPAPLPSSPSSVAVQTFDNTVARRLGGVGVAVRLARGDAGTTAAPARVTVDYSSFGNAYAGGFASRLTVRKVPACMLDAAPSQQCQDRAKATTRTLPVVNDVAHGKLTAIMDAAPAAEASASSGAFVYTLATSASSTGSDATGSFAATDLKPSGTWQVGVSGGEFSYSYPVPAVPPPGGSAPDLALQYSSSSVDSLTSYTNNQAPLVGVGWDLSAGFIERQFQQCALPGERLEGHLCWESPDSDPAGSALTLSVEGRSSKIVKESSSGAYKTEEDFGWKIDYVTSGGESGQPYWKVTTQSGTVYRFGFHRDSSWQVPVLGDDSGEPCHSAFVASGSSYPEASAFCPAAWRWQLDQEVDPNGNVIDYTYARETNTYCRAGGTVCSWVPEYTVSYDRGGYLTQVAYGHNLNVPGSSPTGRIAFAAVDRGTPPDGVTDWEDDTPTDLLCLSSGNCGSNGTPTFFTSKRLDSITASAWNATSSQWEDVTQLKLTYDWIDTDCPDDSPFGCFGKPVLWLDHIQQIGMAGNGPDIPAPPIDFTATLLDNRADSIEYSEDQAPFRMPRISALTTGLGGVTEITYGQANPCDDQGMTGWDVSDQDCYGWELYNYTLGESSIYQNGAIYNKWLVMKTVERDLVAGSPDQVTQYQYVGSPAWARPVELITTPRQCTGDSYLLEEYYPWLQTCYEWPGNWTEWRGYQTVRVFKGTLGGDLSQVSVTASSFYRGLYDDTLADGTAKHTQVSDFDGTAHDDLRVFSGRPLQEQTLRLTGMSTPVFACTYPTWRSGVTYDAGDRVSYQNHHWEAYVSNRANSGFNSSWWTDLGPCPKTTPVPNAFDEESSVRYEYTNVVTGGGPSVYDPHQVNQTREVAREKATSGWRYTETKTEYNADGLPVKVNDYGEPGTATDNTCTVTTYARNTSKWLIDYKGSEEKHAGDDCSAGDLLSRTVTFYDGATGPTSNTPTRGNATETRAYSTASEYSVTKTTFDDYGRPLTSTDPLGKSTTTTYTPAVGWPSGGVAVTNPLGHTATTWSSPYNGEIVGSRDANGNDMNIDYDALGRALLLWTPMAPKSGGTPAAKVAYTIPMNGTGAVTGPPVTATSRLQSGSNTSAKWVTTYSYDDGFGRLREAQSASPAGGRIVQVTTYDARGLTAASSAPAYNSAQPGSGLLNPALTSLPQWSAPVYDALERTVAQVDMSGSGELRRTITNYLGADKYEITPPVGGKTVYYTDTAKQAIKIEEWLTGAGGQQAAAAGPASPAATAGSSAGAASTQPTTDPSPQPKTDESSDVLSASEADAVRGSARAKAKRSGKPVEVAALTSPVSSTLANPDGSFTTTISTQPTRIKRSGTWTAIDTSLVEKNNVLVPQAGPKVQVSNGGTGPFATMADDAGNSIALSWPTPLPRPTVKGNVARYADAAGEGADLLVTVLPGGVRHDIELRERPSGPLNFTIGVKTAGWHLTQDGEGRLQLTDQAGTLVTPVAEPVMHATHPPAPAGERNAASAKAVAAGSRIGAVTTRLTGSGTDQVLTLTPDGKFLADPKTVFPVVVDPTVSLSAAADTWTTTGGGSNSADPSLYVEASPPFFGGFASRSYLKFDTSSLTGAQISSASLKLYKTYDDIVGMSGGPKVSRVTASWNPTTLTWAAQPSVTTTGQATLSASSIHDGAAETLTWPITSIVQAWASGTPNYGLQVREYDETNDWAVLQFDSAEATGSGTHPPQLSVTYTIASAPAAGSLSISPLTGTAVSSLTPALHATVSDPAGGTLRADYEVEHDPAYPAEGTGQIWTGSSSGVSSGSDAPAAVPAGKLTDGWHLRWRARATNTGTSTSSAWSGWQTAVVAVPDPVVDQMQATPSQDLSGTKVTSTLTPGLAARVTTSDGGASRVEFEVEHDPADTAHGAGQIWTTGVDNVASGTQATVTVPGGKLTDGWQVRWRARAVAAGSNASAWSSWQPLTVKLPAAGVSQLQITPSQTSGQTTTVTSLTPQLLATVTDAYGAPLRAEFELEHDPADTAHGTGQIWTTGVDNVASGTQATVTVPGGKLTSGWGIRWRVRAVNATTQVTSAWSGWQSATVDVGNVAPDPAVTALQVTPSSVTGGTTVTTSLAPQLRAQVTNPAGGTLRAEFELEHDPADTDHGTGQIWATAIDDVPAGTQATVTVPDGKLSEGWVVRWRARALAGATASAWSDWQTVTVDQPDPVLGTLQVTPSSVTGGTTVTSSLTPQLLAQVTDPTGGKVRAEFELEHDPADTQHGTGQIWTTAIDDVTSGTQATAAVPDSKLADGWLVRWRARAVTAAGTSAWSSWQQLSVIDSTQIPTIDNPRTQPATNGTTNTLTPALIANVNSTNGGQLGAEFQVEHDPTDTAHGTGQIWTTTVTGVTSGNDAAVTIPTGKLSNGWKIRWRARATRGAATSDWTTWQTITVQAAQHYDTTYEYDRGGRMTKQTDANGNVRTFTYDLLGRRTATHDPDAGESQEAYDAAGQTKWSTNGKGEKISYSYDDLGRKTAVWFGNVGSGTKLAEWVYDTLAKGELTSATRFVNGNAYVDAVTAYDPMGRPTGSTITIPSSENLLAGSYNFSTTYTVSGQVKAQTMPAAGGLPAETVTSTYTDLDLPLGLSSDLGGGFTYVGSTTYDSIGRLKKRSYGANGSLKRELEWNPATGWLDWTRTTTQTETANPVIRQDDRYTYDVSGEIIKILDAASSSGDSAGQSECFAYDGLHRLSQAWTTTAANCGSGTASADSLGIDPYAQSYTYDSIGNITSLTNSGKTLTYGYPPPGGSAVRPNAVNSITGQGGTDSYVYDEAGQLTSRTVGGKAGNFTWNELGQLEKARIDGQDTTMVYDADGERLIRRNPNGKVTLYLGSMEIEVDGDTIAGKRYYTAPDGSTIAMRTGGEGATWLMSGLHGSTQLAVDDTTGKVYRERYLPFGQRRGADDLPFTDHGFLGKIEDDSTKLSYLSARYYDSAIAKFISTDPQLDLRKPQWANPYAYSGNNPIGMSDPTGLAVDGGGGSGGGLAPPSSVMNALPSAKRAQFNRLWNQMQKEYTKRYLGADYRSAARADTGPEAQQMRRLAGAQLAYDICRKINCGDAAWNASVHELLNNRDLEDVPLYGEGTRPPGTRGANGSGNKKGSGAKRPGGCSSSFVPGTVVLMADGSEKPIEEVKIGEMVLAQNPVTGKTEARPVIRLINSSGEKSIIQLTVDIDGLDGDKTGLILSTELHPFWVSDLGHWLNAKDLQVGMHLRSSAGDELMVTAVAGYHSSAQRVYNLTTDTLHTYYVGASAAHVLVHNAASCFEMQSAIANDPYLTRAAKEAGKSNQKGLDHLFSQLSQGNLNPGIGTKALAGTDVMYARADDGARLFFRKVGNRIIIVGKANKGNEKKVIARLKKLYAQ
uniref:DNRLRE domain-containing protein n=1 Tax=Microbispora cellulosiformans TaxID=2614688 RepID=UPI001786CF5C|nr:DNRLRE domain-containing protein [Microbispora cellulosiformans]